MLFESMKNIFLLMVSDCPYSQSMNITIHWPLHLSDIGRATTWAYRPIVATAISCKLHSCTIETFFLKYVVNLFMPV